MPDLVAYFILLFDVFWVYKGLSLTVSTLVAYFRIQASQRLDWMREVKDFGDWKKIRHIVLILVANESLETYEKTLHELAKQTLPLKQIAVVMATEERFESGKN